MMAWPREGTSPLSLHGPRWTRREVAYAFSADPGEWARLRWAVTWHLMGGAGRPVSQTARYADEREARSMAEWLTEHGYRDVRVERLP